MSRSQILRKTLSENLKHFKLTITENQLKMLIVLLENLEILEQEQRIELSEEERTHFGTLYDKAIKLLEEIEKPKKNNTYVQQADYLTHHERKPE